MNVWKNLLWVLAYVVFYIANYHYISKNIKLPHDLGEALPLYFIVFTLSSLFWATVTAHFVRWARKDTKINWTLFHLAFFISWGLYGLI